MDPAFNRSQWLGVSQERFQDREPCFGSEKPMRYIQEEGSRMVQELNAMEMIERKPCSLEEARMDDDHLHIPEGLSWG